MMYVIKAVYFGGLQLSVLETLEPLPQGVQATDRSDGILRPWINTGKIKI